MYVASHFDNFGVIARNKRKTPHTQELQTQTVCSAEMHCMFCTSLQNSLQSEINVESAFLQLITSAGCAFKTKKKIQIYFNGRNVTSAFKKAQSITSECANACEWVQHSVRTKKKKKKRTRTKNKLGLPPHRGRCNLEKKQHPASRSAAPAGRETTQPAAAWLGCLRRVFTTQRQMVSWQRRSLMSPGGAEESRIYQHSFIAMYGHLRTCTRRHRERKRRGRWSDDDSALRP